jgi:hypothetical protein
MRRVHSEVGRPALARQMSRFIVLTIAWLSVAQALCPDQTFLELPSEPDEMVSFTFSSALCWIPPAYHSLFESWILIGNTSVVHTPARKLNCSLQSVVPFWVLSY